MVLFSSKGWAQLSGQNIAEFQLGQIPSDSSTFASLYDRMVIDYDLNKFKLGLTLEQYWTPFEERNFIRPNQLRVQYKSDKWDIKLGHFYETLGRGTLMRTYQVPGAVLEALSFRTRNYFHRDFAGIFAKYQTDKWGFKAVVGQPLDNVFPPNESRENRRPDSLAAIGVAYQIKSHKIEYNAMYLKNQDANNSYSMINLSGNILPELTYYTELTLDHKNKLFGNEDEYGLYVNVNLTVGKIAITSEYKNYNNFRIGEAVNEPPALIKQHTYRTLNRSTHVPIPTNESGWQLEGTYSFENGSIITLNHARADNNLGLDFRFSEYFLEYSKLFNKKYDLKLYVDYANDDVKAEEDRLSSGFDLDILLKKRKSLNIEYEYQRFNRTGFGNSTNMLISFAYNVGSKFTASLLTEYSNDQTVIEEGNNNKIWVGGNFKFKPNFKNTFLLFAGTRRGGPACTSGVCYEILDFEGMELRYTRRF